MLDSRTASRFASLDMFRGLTKRSLDLLPPSWASPLAAFFGAEQLTLPDSPRHVRERLGKSARRLLAKLDADEAQHARLNAVIDRTAPELYALFEQERELRDELEFALLSSEVDQMSVERVQSELPELSSRGSSLVMALLTELTSVLTPAQRARLAHE